MPTDDGQPDAAAAATLQQIVDAHPDFAPPSRDSEAQRYYEANTPQPAANPPQSQPEQAAPAQTAPAPAPTSTDSLIFGKYKSQTEADRGYWELVDKLKQVNAENTALKAVNQHLDTVLGPLRQPREQPTTPTPTYAAVEWQGPDKPVVPLQPAVEAARAAAAEAAREQVQAILGPLQQLNQTQQRLASEFPEFAQRGPQFAQWLTANPAYQERAMRDPDGGLELAYLRFAAEQSQRQPQTSQAAQQQVAQARQNASAPVTQSRRINETNSRAAVLGQLEQQGHQTGNWKPYAKARISEALGDQFLNSLEQTNWGK